MMRKKTVILLLFCTILSRWVYADCPLIQFFPIQNYDQTLENWIDPSSVAYDKSLLTDKQIHDHVVYFKKQFFAAWDEAFMKSLLSDQSPDSSVYGFVQSGMKFFNNEDKDAQSLGYGINYLAYSYRWLQKIISNIAIEDLQQVEYRLNNRAIITSNTQIRALPSDDVFYYDRHLPGQGYPFDHMQVSSLYVGTPIYIIATTRDQAWVLIRTSSSIGWVKANTLQRVTATFIESWMSHALMSFSRDDIAIQDNDKRFLFKAYIGTIFPYELRSNNLTTYYIPTPGVNGYAHSLALTIENPQSVLIPMLPTPHNFSTLFEAHLGHPYDWGGQHFYNDCSGELKHLFSLFGIWLPRQAADQVRVGNLVNVDNKIKNAGDPNERLDYLSKYGHPFMTLIYVDNHIMLYLGVLKNLKTNQSALMTYQALWALHGRYCATRSIIGKNVLFPLLNNYPENKELASLAERKQFVLSYLDKIDL